MKKQLELLEKYGVSNYIIENGKIIINGHLHLSSITSCDKEFLKDTAINGGLDLRGLTSCDKEFLKDTVLNGYLDLNSLTSCDKEFLKDTTINGGLYLDGLTSCDKEFLKDTTINGYLHLSSLTSCDKEFARNNVKKLKVGYNKEKNYCYFDGILNKVKSVTDKKDCKIYTTTSGYIVQKGKFTAHGKTIKKAIEDLRFKCISEQLKNEPINKDTLITIQYYRIITGACEQGVKDFISRNNLKEDSYRADVLFPILEKANAYGFERFKSLISWC